MIAILKTALLLGFIYAPVPFALYISYRILNIADLTTDGSFVLGMAAAAACASMRHPFLGIPAAILAGCAAGFITGILQTRFHVPSVLSGIITNTGLYTIQLMIMGWSSNLSLLKAETLFTGLQIPGLTPADSNLVIAGIITFLVMALLRFLLKTRIGLLIRAAGNNPNLVSSSGINPDHMILLGLTTANGLTGLSGALVGHAQKSANITSGTGIVVIGLAALMIGEALFNRGHRVQKGLFAVLLGNILYRFLYAVILHTNIIPSEGLKLATAVLVAAAMILPDSLLKEAGRKGRSTHAQLEKHQ